MRRTSFVAPLLLIGSGGMFLARNLNPALRVDTSRTGALTRSDAFGVLGQSYTQQVWVMERNPYYWAVDTAGNQLPYIDRVTMTLAENLEVLNLRAMAGEYDVQERSPVVTKAKEMLGYEATTTLDEILDEVIPWIEEQIAVGQI